MAIGVPASNVYSIYIKNYNMDGTFHNQETLMYTVPMEYEEPNALIDPKIVSEMGKAGSLDFNMAFGHPYFNALIQMKTIFRVEYDGKTIFRGRVLTVNAGHMSGNKAVHCEGDFAFFLDSQIEGEDDKTRPKTDVLTYLQKLVANHNAQMSENGPSDKTFVLGEVPGQYTSATTSDQRVTADSNYQYGSTSWKDTQSELTSLANSYGGCFRTRYQNGTTYLDWVDGYYNPTVNPQVIELGENLLDVTSNSEVSNLFTALIPVGSSGGKKLTIKGYQTAIHGDNNRILVPQIAQVFSDDELNKGYHNKQDYLNAITEHGTIYKTQSFPNADTQQKLWEYATDWIKNNYVGGIHEFDVSAMDMHVLGESSGKFITGDRVTVVYPDISARTSNPDAVVRRTLTIMRIEYDLYNPEKNTYQIGIPNMLVNREYGVKKTSSGGGGGGIRNQENIDAGLNGFLNKLDQNNWMFVISAADYNPGKWREYVEKIEDQEVADKFDEAGQQAAFFYLNRYDKLSGPEKLVESKAIIMDGTSGIIDFNHAPFIARFGPEAGNVVRDLAAASLKIKNQTVELDLKECFDPDHHIIPSPFSQEGMRTILKIKADKDGGTFDVGKIINKNTEGFGDQVSTFVASAKDDMIATVKESIGTFDISGNIKETIDNLKGMFNFDGTLDGLDFTIFNGNTDVAELDGLTELFKFGRQDPTDDSPDNPWNVFLNNTVQYKDEHGTNQTKTGFVTAADFNIENEIPSFKTKVAVIDELVASKATISELNAVEAKIDKITGNTIQANSVCRAANLGFTTGYGGNIYCDHFYVQTSGTGAAGDCATSFNDATVMFEDGEFTMRLNRVGGGYKDVTFDVASSAWFTGEVEAVWDGAVGKIDFPTGTRESITLTLPKSGAYGDNPDTETKTLDLVSDGGYVKLRDHSDTSKIYAQIAASGDRSVRSLSATGVESYNVGSHVATLNVTADYTAGSSTSESIEFVVRAGAYTPASSGAGSYAIEVAGDSQKISFTATDAYNDGRDKGWDGCYDTVSIYPSTNRSLAPGSSVTVYARANRTPDATGYTNVASITISTPSQTGATVRRRAVSSGGETYKDMYLYRKTSRVDSSGNPIYQSVFSVGGVGVYTSSDNICNVGASKTVYYS